MHVIHNHLVEHIEIDVAQPLDVQAAAGHLVLPELLQQRLGRSLRADVALVKAWKGDKAGNLVYRMTARNFNPVVATAGKVTVAEVEEIVETGALDPDHIHTPGIYVQRLVLNATPEKRIEQRTVRKG